MITQIIESNLKRYRRMRKYSMETTAMLCGLDRIEYSRLEKGLEELTVNQLEHFANVLEVKVIDLVEEW